MVFARDPTPHPVPSHVFLDTHFVSFGSHQSTSPRTALKGKGELCHPEGGHHHPLPPPNQRRSHGGWVTSATARAIPAPGEPEPKRLIQSKPAAPSLRETPQRPVGWEGHPGLCCCLPTLLPWHQKAARLGRLSNAILRRPSQERPSPYGQGDGAHFPTPGEERQPVRKKALDRGQTQ